MKRWERLVIEGRGAAAVMQVHQYVISWSTYKIKWEVERFEGQLRIDGLDLFLHQGIGPRKPRRGSEYPSEGHTSDEDWFVP